MNRWKDWYEQGKRDRERARLDLRYQYYEWVCFTSQQATEKVVEALALKLGVTLWGHSVTEMVKFLTARVPIPENIIESAKTLDLYYIPDG